MKRIALFDFCGTIVSLQTADEFVRFALKKYNRHVELFIFSILKDGFIIRVLNGFSIHINYKKLYVRLLAGLSIEEIDVVSKEYNDWLCNGYMIKEVFEKLIELKMQGYEIWIVSAGYSCYLKYFHPTLVAKVIATELDFCSGFMTGRISGFDCIGEEKISRLSAINVDKTFEYSISFSDNISDISLLKIAKIGVVVSNGISQKWAVEHGFEEIIWSK